VKSPADLARPEIRSLVAYSSARSVANGTGILLDANENPWPPTGDRGLSLNRYPEPQPARLRRRLSEYLGVPEKCLLITRGSDEGIDLLVRGFCAAGQDRVAVCPPCFGMYTTSASIQGAETVSVPLQEHGEEFGLDEAGLSKVADARLTFLCSPNNPTGTIIDAEALIRLAGERTDRGLVVVDEAYQEFTRQPSAIRLLDRLPNLVVLRTLSKAFALAGCRVGVVAAHPDIINLLARIMPPYPLPTPSIQAALDVLDPENLARMTARVRQLREEREALARILHAHPAVRTVWPGHANFILVRITEGRKLVADAARAGIRLRDQSSQPGLKDCVRITVGTPEENRALARFLETWSFQ